jgi:hypothetical protein
MSMRILLVLLLAGIVGCAHNRSSMHGNEAAPAKTVAAPAIAPQTALAGPPTTHSEQVRTECIEGRRLVCGKVLKVLPEGLVVDSGYSDLLRQPLMESWVIPGTASANRNSASIELKQPGAPCVGWIFLTDIPKRPKVKNFDYVVIMAYPAGQYVYSPAPNMTKTIRRFSAGLDTAVKLSLQAGQ